MGIVELVMWNVRVTLTLVTDTISRVEISRDLARSCFSGVLVWNGFEALGEWGERGKWVVCCISFVKTVSGVRQIPMESREIAICRADIRFWIRLIWSVGGDAVVMR